MREEDVDIEDLREEIELRGYAVDEGALIDGYFIPDGTYRIFPYGCPFNVIGRGDSLLEAALDSGLEIHILND